MPRFDAHYGCTCTGDAAVGKTSLISMFTSKGLKFPKSYLMVRQQGGPQQRGRCRACDHHRGLLVGAADADADACGPCN